MTASAARAVVVDFDGTVTTEDMLDRLLARFGDPAVYAQVEADFAAGRIRLVDDIARKLATVKVPLDELVAWVRREARVRPGWPELVGRARIAGWRVAVVTSSFEELVAPVLGDGLDTVELVANRLEPAAGGWRARWASEAECGVCGEPCKRALLARFRGSELVYVGDGYSDRCAAETADLVLARDGLARHLAERGLAFEPWGDFHDVVAVLERERAAA